MSSSYEISNMENKKLCRVCLTAGDNVKAMNDTELFAYKNVIPTNIYKITFNHLDMFICIYCSYLLRKVQKFVQQCLRAENVITNCYEKDSKSLNHNIHNFTITTETHQLPDDVLEDNDNHDYEDDVPLVMLKSEDEPLVMEKKRRKRKSQDSIKTEATATQKCELPSEGRTKKVKQKRQKVIREGFSSRMVQETDEYVVVKLTKEQVLQEMERRSRTAEYQKYLYKCDKCVRGFNFEDVLAAHMQKHTSENGSLKCEICSQYCPSAVSLRGHMKSHTTRYSCKVCGLQRGSRQHLLEHHAAHAGAATLHRCTHCAFTTNKRTVMQRHARSHAPVERLACHRCGRLCKNLETLRVHTARHDKSRLLRCPQCPAAFVYPALLRRHEAAVHRDADHYCVECDLRFKSPEILRMHFKRSKRHRDASSYKHGCGMCPQRFPSPAALAAHLCTAHGLPKQHSCEVCHRDYSTRAAVRAHARRSHADLKNAETCRVCARSFTRKSVLCAHERTQSGAAMHRHQQKEDSDLINVMPQEIPNEG